jgi:hypothetical protein
VMSLTSIEAAKREILFFPKRFVTGFHW